jgi:formylglycine-generating enzyme required for sulfatase activity
MHFTGLSTFLFLKKIHSVPLWVLLLFVCACNPATEQQQYLQSNTAAIPANDSLDCHSVIPQRLAVQHAAQVSLPQATASTKGMVLIEGGTFLMGADNEQGRRDEYPKHQVKVKSFYMDTHEVTNAQFRKFIEATGYVTTAEKKPDWEELKKQLPPGTPKPSEDLLVASSLVFSPPAQQIQLTNAAQWWNWVAGADWRHPDGPASSTAGKDNHPVVHISWDDAMAYCQWAGKRLPTEAEWEWAARGGKKENIYPWGNEPIDQGKVKANSWQGQFPYNNTKKDAFYGLSPVGTYAPNGYGLYDMAGNVWEWCSDWYHASYYQTVSNGADNPQGPSNSFDPEEPTVPKKVVRGGSYLCNDSYCSGYRVAARMKSSRDTGLSHTGFRCVADKEK